MGLGDVFSFLLAIGTLACAAEARGNRTARQIGYPNFYAPSQYGQQPPQFPNGFSLGQPYQPAMAPPSSPNGLQFQLNLPGELPFQQAFSSLNPFFNPNNPPLSSPTKSSFKPPFSFNFPRPSVDSPMQFPAGPPFPSHSSFGFQKARPFGLPEGPMLPSPMLSSPSAMNNPFAPPHSPSSMDQSLVLPFPQQAELGHPMSQMDKNIFPWPYFEGVKRLSLGSLCRGRSTVALGRCSAAYLRCSDNGLQYSFEECSFGQVFHEGHCRPAYEECIQMHMYRLSVETQYLMQDSHFCMQGEGAYIASANQCSRQAIICKDFSNGFAVSCTQDTIISPTTLECVSSPSVCSSWSISPQQFAPWKFALINYHCLALSQTQTFSHFSWHSRTDFTCRNWYVDCRESVKEIITCDAGHIFDHQSGRCRQPDRGEPCFAPAVSCSGRDWFNVALGKCQSEFARCEGGLTKKYLCSEGFLFFEGHCVHPSLTHGTCPVCTNGQTTQLSHQTCNQYSQCERGRWVQRICPHGQGFSVRRRMCVLHHSCVAAVGSCQSGSRMKISCSEYMECSWDGHYHRKACPLFHSWHSGRQQCVFDTSCAPDLRSGCTDGQIIDSWDCVHYFQCSKGHWLKHPCGDGRATGGCQRCNEGFYQQQVGRQIECLEGATRHDLTDCSFYGRCQGGSWRREHCYEGMFWNQQHGQCMQTGDCPQFRATECLEMERIAYNDGVRCDGFFECRQGAWSLFSCPSGHIFDTRANRCMTSSDGCSSLGPVSSLPIIRPPITSLHQTGPISYFPEQATLPAGPNCDLGSFIANDFDCRQYYTCTKAGLVPSACLPGMAFNPVTRMCDKSYHCDLTSCIDGHMRPGKKCGEFRKCVSGHWTSKKCPGNQYFEAGRCHPSFGKCGVLPHSTCFNGQALPVDKDCSSYLVCQDGLLQRKHCEDGAFFNPSAGYCDGSYQCPFCSPNEMKPCEDDCKSYTICVGGHLERRTCPEHHFFDATSFGCRFGTCGGQIDALETCLESPGQSGYRPHPRNRHKFLQCAQGRWVPKDCPANLVWNQKILVCDWPRNVH